MTASTTQGQSTGASSATVDASAVQADLSTAFNLEGQSLQSGQIADPKSDVVSQLANKEAMLGEAGMLAGRLLDVTNYGTGNTPNALLLKTSVKLPTKFVGANGSGQFREERRYSVELTLSSSGPHLNLKIDETFLGEQRHEPVTGDGWRGIRAAIAAQNPEIVATLRANTLDLVHQRAAQLPNILGDLVAANEALGGTLHSTITGTDLMNPTTDFAQIEQQIDAVLALRMGNAEIQRTQIMEKLNQEAATTPYGRALHATQLTENLDGLLGAAAVAYSTYLTHQNHEQRGQNGKLARWESTLFTEDVDVLCRMTYDDTRRRRPYKLSVVIDADGPKLKLDRVWDGHPNLGDQRRQESVQDVVESLLATRPDLINEMFSQLDANLRGAADRVSRHVDSLQQQ